MAMSNEGNMLSSRLKELRAEAEISQYKLAEDLGLSRSMISNYEQGTREPDFGTLKTLSDYFDVSIDYLLGVSSMRRRFLSQKELLYYSDLLTQIGDIKELSMAQISELIGISKNFGDIVGKLNSLSDESISELQSYIKLLELRDSLEITGEDTSSAFKNLS